MKPLSILQNKNFLLGLGIFVLFALLAVFASFSLLFGRQYSQQVNVSTPTRQLETGTQTFDVKRIRIKDSNTGLTIEILKNGTASVITSDNHLANKKILSNETIFELFSNLTQEEFLNLLSNYFSDQHNLEITIETNYGTKTIVVDENGTEPLPEEIEDIIDDTEDIEEELEEPPASPPPSLPPTPTPSPGTTSSPTPSPNPFGPTPSPTPLPPGVTPEPFTCAMLNNLGVTVSNIRCADDLN